jgi:hypothetical protein
MGSPDVGVEAGRAVGYGGVAVLLVKGFELLAKAFGSSQSARVAELDATMRTAAAIRDELRKDNETMRHRIGELELENAKLKDLNEKLDDIHGIIDGGRTRTLAHVALLTKHVAQLLPEDIRAQFAAETAKTELEDAKTTMAEVAANKSEEAGSVVTRASVEAKKLVALASVEAEKVIALADRARE